MGTLNRITEADLRSAMQDRRYWQSGHPERQRFADWVMAGFNGLYPNDAAPRPAVWIRAYVRDGHRVQAHWRTAPSRNGSNGRDASENDTFIVQANWARVAERVARAIAGGRGGVPALRRPGLDRVDDLRQSSAFERFLGGGVREYKRGGGLAQRDRDLANLHPVGRGEVKGSQGNVTSYDLADGRRAIVRSSTRGDRPATLEIQERSAATGRFDTTDKFRYR